MNQKETPQQRPNGGKKNMGNKTLAIIWGLFLAYIALIFYFFAQYKSNDANRLAEQLPINETILETSPQDSLLAEFINAFEKGDFEKAREISRILNERYPNSPHALRAAELMATIDGKEENSRGLASDEPAPKTQTQPAAKTRAVPVARKSKPPVKITPPPFDDSVLEAALSKLRKEEDRQRGITWYYNKNVSHYVYKNSFEAYIGKNENGDVWLRMRIYYSGDSRLNIDSYEINVGDKDYPITTLYGKMERGKGSGGEWEWYDAQVAQKDLRMLEAVMQPGPTAIRYIGKNGNFNRMMTEPEKVRLKNIMEAYQALAQKQSYLSSLR